MPATEGARGGLRYARGEYDFAVDGGAIGSITLRAAVDDPLGNDIPANAIILGGLVEVDTAVLSATGTVAIAAEAAGDILAATGQAGLTVGRKSVIPAFTGAASVKTTARRQLVMAIATAALTAGKFRVIVWYV